MIPGAGHDKTGQYSTSPLLVNPGGPGGAGAAFILGIGNSIQTIVSSDGSQDVVGFDPRGVGATTPTVNCWAYPSEGNETSREDAKTGVFQQMICKLRCFLLFQLFLLFLLLHLLTLPLFLLLLLFSSFSLFSSLN